MPDAAYENIHGEEEEAMNVLRATSERSSPEASAVWRYCASRVLAIAVALGVVLGAGPVAWRGVLSGIARAEDEPQFTTDFHVEDCKFATKEVNLHSILKPGGNPYFILKPGYQLVLEGEDEGDALRLVITVLRTTEKIFLPGVGIVKARVVEERETKNGVLVEVSRNFFALCQGTNDVFYFGEDVDIFKPDGTITHDGAWRAGVAGALPGIIMPGRFLLGSRYFQEVAPGVALDRAEHVEMGLAIQTEAGAFSQCVKVIETTPLEPGAESEKRYCRGVGLVGDGDELELVDFGFNIVDDD